MAEQVKIVVDNTDLVKNASKEAIERALTAAGFQCEGYAKMLCPVDTGNLRNSITSSLGGQWMSTRRTVTIGTNVEYAIYVHEGHRLPKKKDTTPGQRLKSMFSGKKDVPPRRFLKDALINNADEYKQIIEIALKGALW